MGGVCGTNGRNEPYIHGFGGKPKGKRPLARPLRR
jgi:hypothetical protein